MKIEFQSKYTEKGEYKASFDRYTANGNVALEIFTLEGEPQVTASCNLTSIPPLPDDEMAVKDWSENEGVWDALVAAGLIFFKEPIRVVKSGFVKVKIAHLTPIAVKEVKTMRD